MPTYDYICTACHQAWELEQRIVEDPVRKCPKCGANTAKRQISSGAGFILKGSGWYADGYGSKKPSSSEPKSDDTALTGESKAEKKGESDPKKPGETTSGKTKSEPKKPDAKGGSGGGAEGGSGGGSGGGGRGGGGNESKASAA
jgi:putative FmdB family regulatory protein